MYYFSTERRAKKTASWAVGLDQKGPGLVTTEQTLPGDAGLLAYQRWQAHNPQELTAPTAHQLQAPSPCTESLVQQIRRLSKSDMESRDSRGITLETRILEALLEQPPTASDKFFIYSRPMIAPNGFVDVFH